MEFLAWLILGFFAAFAITWSIANDDSEGPFYIYLFIRRLARSRYAPKLVRENASCPYCVSFWAAVLVTSLLPIYSGKSWVENAAMFFVVAYGLHGAIVFYFRYVKLMYQVGASEL